MPSALFVANKVMRSPWSRTRMPMPCVASLKSWDGPTRTLFFPLGTSECSQCIVAVSNLWKSSSVRIAFLLNQERENFRKSLRRSRHPGCIRAVKTQNVWFGTNWYYITIYCIHADVIYWNWPCFQRNINTWYEYIMCIHDMIWCVYIYIHSYYMIIMIWHGMIWYDTILYDTWYVIHIW